MDQAAVSKLNSSVERVHKLVQEVERRSEAQAAVAAEKEREQTEWARTQIALDEKQADLSVHANDELEESVARLQLQRAQAVERNDAARLQAEADRTELEELHESIDELRQQLTAIPERERTAETNVGVAKIRLDKLAQDIATGERRSKRKIDGLTEKIETYQQALGLEIETPSETKIVFKLTCVDETDVAKEHIVTIQRVSGVSGDDKYVALSTAPSVPSFSALAAAFKKDQDAASLLRKARAAFQALYKEAQQV